MPYIDQESRKLMRESIHMLSKRIYTKGDLNYAICEIVGRVIIESEKISYTSMSELIDAVHDAETELRRRLLDPYEDKKIKENGDVESFTEILKEV